MAGFFWSLLAVAAGAFIAVQAPINAQLSKGLGLPVLAAGFSFLSGAVVLMLVSAVVIRGQQVAVDWRAPATWLFVAGGILGAGYVVTAVILIPRIGTAALMAFLVTGQLLAGMLLDRAGVLGLAVREITLGRLAGAVMLLAGALLIRLT